MNFDSLYRERGQRPRSFEDILVGFSWQADDDVNTDIDLFPRDSPHGVYERVC